MLLIRRAILTPLNNFFPGWIDETIVETEGLVKVRAKLETFLKKSFDDNKIKEEYSVTLEALAKSLSSPQQFLNYYSIHHLPTKALLWNMFHIIGTDCQTDYIKTLERIPVDPKTVRAEVFVGIIYGHTFDFTFENGGQNILSPLFSGTWKQKGEDNYPRPFLLVGNLFFDYDPLLNLCIPRKCTRKIEEITGSLFKIGDIFLQHPKQSLSLMASISIVTHAWNVEFDKYSREIERGSYDFVINLLENMSNYDNEFKHSYDKNFNHKFHKALNLVENYDGTYVFELDDGLCKTTITAGLPRELTSYDNKKVSFDSKQQLRAYILLLEYSIFFAKSEQISDIKGVIHFVKLYEFSLEDKPDVKPNYYYHRATLVTPEVYEKGLEEYKIRTKSKPKPKITKPKERKLKFEQMLTLEELKKKHDESEEEEEEENDDFEEEATKVDEVSTLLASQQSTENESLLNIVDSKIRKKGYLYKRGGGNKGLKRRYFVLAPKRISYFETDATHDPKGTIELSDIKSCYNGGKEIEIEGETHFEFQIQVVNSSRVFQFYTNNIDDLFDWIEKINEACGGMDKKKSLKQLISAKSNSRINSPSINPMTKRISILNPKKNEFVKTTSEPQIKTETPNADKRKSIFSILPLGQSSTKLKVEEDDENKHHRKMFSPRLLEETKIIDKSLNEILEEIKEKQIEFKNMDQNRYFFSGKPAKSGDIVYYFILSRVDVQFLNPIDYFVAYLYKTIRKSLEKEYVLVIDCSWEKLSDENTSLFPVVCELIRLMKKSEIKGCQNILVVHPTLKLMEDIQKSEDVINGNLYLPHNQSLVKYIYDWSELTQFIESKNIGIPFSSKKFQPIIYSVHKVTSKDKLQERLLKLTLDSILVLDPFDQRVHLEILYSDLQAVCCRKDAYEIFMQYVYNEDKSGLVTMGKGSSVHKNAQKKSVQSLRLTCDTEAQRDALAEMIYDLSIHSNSLFCNATFDVNIERENQKKKIQNYLKFTHDSICVFENKLLAFEINYSIIESFKLDDDNFGMDIKYMKNGRELHYIFTSEDTEDIKDALEDAIQRFIFYIETEQELFKRVKVDQIIAKLFDAVKTKIDEVDNEQWKQIYYIDPPVKDVRKLYKKFKPDKTNRCNIDKQLVLELSEKMKLEYSEQDAEHLIKVLDPTKRDSFS
eukprot:gene287-6702_t